MDEFAPEFELIIPDEPVQRWSIRQCDGYLKYFNPGTKGKAMEKRDKSKKILYDFNNENMPPSLYLIRPSCPLACRILGGGVPYPGQRLGGNQALFLLY